MTSCGWPVKFNRNATCVIWGDPINPLFRTHTESIPQGYGIYSAGLRNPFRTRAEYEVDAVALLIANLM